MKFFVTQKKETGTEYIISYASSSTEARYRVNQGIFDVIVKKDGFFDEVNTKAEALNANKKWFEQIQVGEKWELTRGADQ